MNFIYCRKDSIKFVKQFGYEQFCAVYLLKNKKYNINECIKFM